MAEDHRRLAEEVAQGVLLDDPTFLKEIVERVLQESLEAEMIEHLQRFSQRLIGCMTAVGEEASGVLGCDHV